MRHLLWLAVAILLAACSTPPLDEVIQHKTEEALSLLEAEDRDPAVLAALVDSELSTEDELSASRRIMSIFPHEPVKERSIVSWQSSWIMKGVSSYYIAYYYEFQTSFMAVEVWLTRDAPAATPRITSLTATPLTGSMREQNRFTLEGKSVGHYLFGLWMILAPLFALGTMIICLRSPIGRRKRWWWLICLLGVFPMAFNWTTGFLQFQVFSITLISIGASRVSEFTPYILQSYIPLGAILFWIRRRRLVARAAA